MKTFAALALAALLLAGCARKNDTPEAILQGVRRDISKSFNVDKMDLSVDAVSFRDKEADATVTFTLKGGSKDQGMTMKYLMERHDDNQWYIKSRVGQPAMPGAEAATGAAALPAGHPAMGAGAPAAPTNLPPGHPEIGK